MGWLRRRRSGFRVTTAGWAVVLLALVGWGAGVPMRWTELRLVGAAATLVVLVCLLAVLWPQPATAAVTARPPRTSVGAKTVIAMDVRARLLPVVTPVVRLEGDIGSQVLRLRTLWPWRTRSEPFAHVAERRGIFTLGPVRHLQSDPLGLFRRTRSWGSASTLWVRPRVAVPESFSQGGVFDLEGVPSDQISMSDLAFHALREYMPGDDLRRVHWRSSAKANKLLVRQYHESRNMHAAVVVDDDPGSYATPEEFETAISAGASLAIRALTDGFDVDLGCGGRVSVPVGREGLLDETCAWALAPRDRPTVDVLARASHLARTGTAIGVAVVVSGSTCDLERLLEAASAFGGEAQRIAVRVDPGSGGGVRVSHGVRVLEIAELGQLPRLAALGVGVNPTPRSLDIAVDLVAVVALSAVALLGLDDSFAGRAYLVTGMVAVLAVTGWALLCTVQRYPAGVFLLVYSIAFPVLGATAALHNYDLLGFPAPSAMLDLLTATLTAPGEFLTTIPPVDARGDVLAIPYVVGFVLCGPASWAALRTRRPLLPAVPLVLAMVTCIVLGTEQPRELALRSALFAGGLLLWVSLRAARLSNVVHAARGRSLRAVVGAGVAVGAVLLASTWLPGVPHQDRAVLRGRIGSGQDVSQLDNPLASFRKFTSQPAGAADNVNAKRLLRVTGLPRSDLLRFVALDVYDGTQWTAGNRTVVDDNAALFQRIGRKVGAPFPGRPVRVAVEVKRAWTSSWLPLTGQLTGLSFDYLDGEAQLEDVRYNVATQTGMVVGGLQGGDDYHFTATVPTSRLTRAMRPYGSGAPLQPSGGFLDTSLRPWRTSGLTPVQQVFSIARYLRTNGRYSNGGTRLELGYLPGHSPQRLGPGFFGARSIVGDDEQYAAFMALAANRLGVPARVLVGAAPDRQGWVRGRNVLAWVEVRVADGSWRVLATDRFMSHKPPSGVVVRPTPENYVESTAEKPTDRPPLQQPQEKSPVPQSVQEVGRNWALWGLPLVVGLVLLVPGLKLLRRRRRRRAAPVSARFVGGWQELLDLLSDLGREVPAGLPRTEQAHQLGVSLELARAADIHVFGRDEPLAEQAAAYWHSVVAERRRLAREAGPFRRVASAWAVRSLLQELRSAARRWRRAGARAPWRRAFRPSPGE